MNELAFVALENFRGEPNFIKRVMMPLSRDENEFNSSVFRQELYVWLVNSPQKTNLWAEAFSLIASAQDIDQRLVATGLSWLNDNINLNRWKNVWDILASKDKEAHVLINLAHKWIERADPQIRIWPNVMISILERQSFGNYEIRLAKRWLDSHSDKANTESFKRLAELVEENQTAFQASDEIISP